MSGRRSGQSLNDWLRHGSPSRGTQTAEDRRRERDDDLEGPLVRFCTAHPNLALLILGLLVLACLYVGGSSSPS